MRKVELCNRLETRCFLQENMLNEKCYKTTTTNERNIDIRSKPLYFL